MKGNEQTLFHPGINEYYYYYYLVKKNNQTLLENVSLF